MPDPVITRLEQVTPEWLTEVLTRNGALAQGAVAAFDVDTGRGNWSTNASLRVRYVEGAQGARPRRLFLKLVNADLGDGESFDDSEVNYYTRDYAGVAGDPLVRCYAAAFSGSLKRYHLLLDDLSETHVEAAARAPTGKVRISPERGFDEGGRGHALGERAPFGPPCAPERLTSQHPGRPAARRPATQGRGGRGTRSPGWSAATPPASRCTPPLPRARPFAPPGRG